MEGPLFRCESHAQSDPEEARPGEGDSEKADQHLSQIHTMWPDVQNAHSSSTHLAKVAWQRLFQRYGRAIHRYLLGSLRDAHAADELFQEFALRMVGGAFQGADPGRGRFRDYLKSALYHLIIDYQRKRRKDLVARPANYPEPADKPPAESDFDQEFLSNWRSELLARAWEALARWEQNKGKPLYTVLRFRADHPDMPAPQMAEQLAPSLGKQVTPGWVRKQLHLAREQFTDFLVEEVAQSLPNPTDEEVGDELLALGLLDNCRAALERRSGSVLG